MERGEYNPGREALGGEKGWWGDVSVLGGQGAGGMWTDATSSTTRSVMRSSVLLAMCAFTWTRCIGLSGGCVGLTLRFEPGDILSVDSLLRRREWREQETYRFFY